MFTLIYPLSSAHCSRPVARAEVVFGQDLLHIASPLDYSIESGYVNVTSNDFLFYYFCQAVSKVKDTAPLLIWTNGGPGCSSMEGALTEMAPVWLYNILKGQIKSKNAALTPNVYGWNNFAHLLFIDQPRTVGFSYGAGSLVTSLKEAADDFVNFMVNWLILFPEHRDRNIILAGESYGGQYVSAWVDAIIDFNERAAEHRLLHVTGMLLVTGCIAKHRQFKDAMLRPSSPWLRKYSASDILRTNKMDSRLDVVSNDGDYDYTQYTKWLSRDDVRSALNICGDNSGSVFLAGKHCSFMQEWNYTDNYVQSVHKLGKALSHGINVTYLIGMQDILCSFPEELNALESIEWSGKEGFRQAPLTDLIVAGVRTGAQKFLFSGAATLRYIQAEQAGHMVPRDDPVAALVALQSLLPSRIDGSLNALTVFSTTQDFIVAAAVAALAVIRRYGASMNLII